MKIGKNNFYEEDGDFIKVGLSSGQVTVVDKDVWPLLDDHKWYAIYNKTSKSWYAVCPCLEVQGITYMHRFILQAPSGLLVDHWDKNTLNNRKTNLRLVTKSQNAQNVTKARSTSKTGILGVSVHKCKPTGLMYCARCNVTVNGKVKSHAKYFPYTPQGLEDAAAAVKVLRADVMTHSDGR